MKKKRVAIFQIRRNSEGISQIIIEWDIWKRKRREGSVYICFVHYQKVIDRVKNNGVKYFFIIKFHIFHWEAGRAEFHISFFYATLFSFWQAVDLFPIQACRAKNNWRANKNHWQAWNPLAKTKKQFFSNFF